MTQHDLTPSRNNDKRIFALLALGLLAALLGPFIIAALGRDDLVGGFALVAGLLALLFGALGWSERMGRTVTILLLLLFVGGGTGMAVFVNIRVKQLRAKELRELRQAQELGKNARGLAGAP